MSLSFLFISQSFIDFAYAVFLLLTTLTIEDVYKTKSDGILGQLECQIWNSKLLLWAPLISSTWNLVCLTIERLELFETNFNIRHKMLYISQELALSLPSPWQCNLVIDAAFVPKFSLLVDPNCELTWVLYKGSWKSHCTCASW